ncbi:hypothetical protein V500_10050, partial [Pseudogymnoascus sp. VKM F-4518 (FW-2643)]
MTEPPLHLNELLLAKPSFARASAKGTALIIAVWDWDGWVRGGRRGGEKVREVVERAVFYGGFVLDAEEVGGCGGWGGG